MRSGRPIAASTLPKMLQQHAIAAVPHGFRSSFRDWAAEETDHPREVIEAALAHVVQNKVEAAYARSDLFERRRRLMDDWAAYLAATRRPTLNDLRKTALACTGGRGDMVARPFCPAGRRERIARAVRALAVAALCAATATSSPAGKGTRNDREDAGGNERPGRQARRDVLLCHVMLRTDVLQTASNPDSRPPRATSE